MSEFHNWDFTSLDQDPNQKSGSQADPITKLGFRMNMDDNAAKSKSKTTNTELLEKKAWELAIAPIQSVGMNLFMLWMSGSSPGIFTIMILGYCMQNIVGQFTKMNTVFLPYKSINTTLQKMAYLGLCLVSLAYLLYHASGMGVLPTSTGDWIAYIPNDEIVERATGVLK